MHMDIHSITVCYSNAHTRVHHNNPVILHLISLGIRDIIMSFAVDSMAGVNACCF